MACARPVIGSRSGGIVDQIIDGETGFLVQPGDVGALRDAMQCLVDNAPLRQQMGAAALKRLEDFQASSVVERIEKVYESL